MATRYETPCEAPDDARDVVGLGVPTRIGYLTGLLRAAEHRVLRDLDNRKPDGHAENDYALATTRDVLQHIGAVRQALARTAGQDARVLDVARLTIRSAGGGDMPPPIPDELLATVYADGDAARASYDAARARLAVHAAVPGVRDALAAAAEAMEFLADRTLDLMRAQHRCAAAPLVPWQEARESIASDIAAFLDTCHRFAAAGDEVSLRSEIDAFLGVGRARRAFKDLQRLLPDGARGDIHMRGLGAADIVSVPAARLDAAMRDALLSAVRRSKAYGPGAEHRFRGELDAGRIVLHVSVSDDAPLAFCSTRELPGGWQSVDWWTAADRRADAGEATLLSVMRGEGRSFCFDLNWSSVAPCVEKADGVAWAPDAAADYPVPYLQGCTLSDREMLACPAKAPSSDRLIEGIRRSCELMSGQVLRFEIGGAAHSAFCVRSSLGAKREQLRADGYVGKALFQFASQYCADGKSALLRVLQSPEDPDRRTFVFGPDPRDPARRESLAGAGAELRRQLAEEHARVSA